MTNADRIRAMSDGELKDLLLQSWCQYCAYCAPDGACVTFGLVKEEPLCSRGIEKWLEMEAKE